MVMLRNSRKRERGQSKKAFKVKPKQSRKEDDFDEVVSSDSELDETEIIPKVAEQSDSEDENETAQEKKMRLTKKYLEELKMIKEQNATDDEKDLVGEQLQEDVLEKAGRLQKKIAAKCLPPDEGIIKVLKGHKLSVICMAVSSDGLLLFTGSKDCSIIKWDLKTHKKLHVMKGGSKIDGVCHRGHVLCLALSTDMKFLASGGRDKLIHIWNPNTCEHLHTFKGHRNAVSGVSIRANSHQLFSSSHDRTVKVWDLDALAYVETLYGHQDAAQSCDSLNRERCVTAGGRDGSIRIWKIVEESQLLFHGHSGSIDCVRLINEEHMISGSDDGSVCLWSVMKKRPIAVVQQAHRLEGVPKSREMWISAVASLTNSDLIATGSSDGYIRLWKCEGKFLKLTPLFNVSVPGFINDMRFTNNGLFLIAAVGQEHKLGRWWKLKDAKNFIYVIPIQGNAENK
ncbi:unnamed protein product [Clavelina lepadiformis]|uniref:U3 small nucleolar RNA-interacting protein 2 n=1 Tax=Clavelina lepadiformis TaxID=159417 RepID=A0ABP0GRR8_CLALP